MLSNLFDKFNPQKNAPEVGQDSVSPIQEKPKICLIDIDPIAENALKEMGYNCLTGSFGQIEKLPNSKVGDHCLCRLKYSIPDNLHEFDILVLDMKDTEPVEYDKSTHSSASGKKAARHLLLCDYPQTIFDPRPLVGSLQLDTLREFRKKESLLIVFADASESVNYKAVELNQYGYKNADDFSHFNYSFLPSQPYMENKIGLETRIVSKNPDFAVFLTRYNKEFVYQITFDHPQIRVEEKRISDPNFLPLVLNADDEIVSYASIVDSLTIIVFPQMQDKVRFLIDLFQTQLPEISPKLFPFNSQFGWLKNSEYQLPNEEKLLEERRLIEQEYKENILSKNREIEENRREFKFLHELLMETGEHLVKTVEGYFHWLGFNDVVNFDETHPGHREEDLQVMFENGLLVVEVKGLGGTSKDGECAQINKIKHRRERERKAFDVYALYVVNHQRHLPPTNRANPPFTKHQIDDAIDDERGLLTTYELFKLYFAIHNGFVTKEDARRQLVEYGLVTFNPSNSLLLGTAREIHYDGKVGVFDLDNFPLIVSEELVVSENGHFRLLKIAEMKLNNQNVERITDGEVGIKFFGIFTKDAIFWKRK